jgi:cleavage stimulation factor subunit 1
MNEEKNHLYQLILRQLVKDGYARAAEALSDSALLPLEQAGIRDDEPDLEAIVHHHHLTHVSTRESAVGASGAGSSAMVVDPELLPSSLDFSMGSQRARKPAPVARFNTRLQGGHAVGAFNWDGSLFAAGVADGSIKVIDSLQAYRADLGEETLAPVVLKSLFDHTEAVTGLAFHGRARVLLSCSKDKTIRMFAFNSMSTRSFECITDTHPVRSIALHPSGDFIIAGCNHPVLRLYQTEQPQAPALVAVAQHHSAAVNHVNWSLSGSQYVSASRDGTVKLWDATSSHVSRTLSGAHGGAEVYSAAFSRSGTFLLTAGADGCARVFDVRTGGALRVYKGLVNSGEKVTASFAGLNEE